MKISSNKSIKFARNKRGLDAAHKTRIATYFKRYILKTKEGTDEKN